MDVQGTKPDTQQWPQQRAPKRKRGKKKSKAAKLAFPEPRLLHEDQDRARCERKLLADTQARLRHMDADRNRELAHLFRNKSSLPVGQRERAEDDHLRRVAVREIMEAREKAGIEPVGEAVLWAGVSTDITNELRKKFPKHHFKKLRDRSTARKSQRRFLDWVLQQPNRGGIPARRVEWIRSLLNETVRLTRGSELIPRMQAVYYMAACCNAAGVPIFAEIEELAGDPSAEMHNWLMKQEPAFFEQENFSLDFGYVMNLNIERLSKTSAQQFGSTADNPIELDDDDEEGKKQEADQEEEYGEGHHEEVAKIKYKDDRIQRPAQTRTQPPIRQRAVPLLARDMLPEPVLDINWRPRY